MPNDLARRLRKAPTMAEQRLWRHVRGKQLNGARFRRQHPIVAYVADFVCLERRLVVELGGGHHTEPDVETADMQRTDWLRAEGYRVLRFWNTDVIGNIEGVVDAIRDALGDGTGADG